MSGTNPSRHSLHEALAAVLRLLGRRRIPYMVMGGLALSVWGRVRVTQDVDLALALPEDQEDSFLTELQKAHFLPAAPRILVGHRLLICRYLKSSKGLPVQVDLFFARGSYQARAIERAVEVKLGRRAVRVISAEDLILYKLLADRPIDQLDARSVVEEQGGRLDRDYLARWAKRLGLASQMRKLYKN